MKKLLFAIIAALLILPGLVLAQGDTLSHADIARISNSVVLVLSFDDKGQPYASGSGTIISPTGLIYTNRHVLEGGSDYAILTLSDVGEAAQLAYYASPTLIHPQVDFAELQIDRDANGRSIDASKLNLPFIALSNTLPEIGDRIFVFGYPSLGDAHLVMTSGSITTVQNDTLDGQRIPFWYQTDAQISPGNSGGLVVNSQGQMLGIPTMVRSEEETLGRLGGILSLTAIRDALQDQKGQQGRSTPVPTQPPKTNGQTTSNQQLSIDITNVEFDVTRDDSLGITVHAKAEAVGYLDTPLRAAIFVFWQDGSILPANNRAIDDDRTDEGQLTVQQVITPGYDDTVWDDMWFFVPYSVFPEGRIGAYPAYFEAQLGLDGQAFTAFSSDSSFNYQYPAQQLIVDITSVEHNVDLNKLTGMKVHTHINTLGYQGQKLRVALFLYWKDGTPIPGSDAPADDRTTSGYLTVQSSITPSHDNSNWDDYWFFIPYDYFPGGLHGDQDGYAEVEIGPDSGDFVSWSRNESFILTYP